MPRLSDLNRSKRDAAYSGRSNIGDVPWLYALQDQQAAANQPAGIGQGGGMQGDEAAPNPMAAGVGGVGSGGAGGAADTGMPGPGQTGFGEEGDQFFRAIMDGRGGQAGEPGGAGAGGIEFGDPSAFVDPTLAEWTGYLAPFPLSLIGTFGAGGMRAHNAGLLDEAARSAGGTGLSGWQMAGAALGPTLGNAYGDFGYEDTAGALSAAGAGRSAGTGGLGAGAGDWADAVVDLGPREEGNRTGSWAGGLDDGGSAYSGGAAIGGSASARQAERNRDRGGGAGEGGGGGGGGFGCFVGDTHILMADGSRKKIRLIEKGDMVMSFDGLGPLEPREVVATMEYKNQKPIRVYFGDGKGVVVTPEHPFLTDSGEYRKAGDLEPRDLLVNAEGFLVPVLEINRDAKRATVYNFEVEGLHTYVAKGLRVHNIKHAGGVISEDRVPGQLRGDVPETLQEGEGVLTADAVEVLGPGFIHGVNMMARMMRSRG